MPNCAPCSTTSPTSPDRLAAGGQQVTIAQTALQAAEASGDVKGQALCHLSLRAAAVALGDLNAASEDLETARQHSIRIHYARGIELACGNLLLVPTSSGTTRASIPFACLARSPTVAAMHQCVRERLPNLPALADAVERCLAETTDSGKPSG